MTVRECRSRVLQVGGENRDEMWRTQREKKVMYIVLYINVVL